MLVSFFKNNKKIIISVLLLVVFYKLILFLIGFLDYYYTFKVEAFSAWKMLTIWGNWDGGHYLSIAKSGYDLAQHNIAFFPLYPLLINIFSVIFGYELSAYLINVFALIGALVGLYKLVELEFDTDTAWRSIFYLLLFPTAVFLTAMYSISLFLFFAIWCAYFIRKKNWLVAGIFGYFAGLIRIEGLALSAFMLYEFLSSYDFKPKKEWKKIFFTLTPIFGLLTYFTYLYFQFGDFLIFFSALSNWEAKPSTPWDTLGDYIVTFFDFSIATTPYYLARAVDLISLIAGLILAVPILLRFRISYGIYTVGSLFLVLFTGQMAGVNRRLLFLFPLIILLAKWGKNQVVNFIILFIFSNLFALFALRYLNGLWAG